MRITKNSHRTARSGMTLLEATIAMTMLATFVSSVYLSVGAATQSYRTEGLAARLDRRAREAVQQVCERLRLADASSLAASVSSVDLDACTGWGVGAPDYAPTERIVLEPDPQDPDDGADNDGDGLVDEGRLVWIEAVGTALERRQILANGVSEVLEGEVALNGADDNGNGLTDEPGFCLQVVGASLVVRLTVEELDPHGTPIRRTATRSVTARNIPE